MISDWAQDDLVVFLGIGPDGTLDVMVQSAHAHARNHQVRPWRGWHMTLCRPWTGKHLTKEISDDRHRAAP